MNLSEHRYQEVNIMDEHTELDMMRAARDHSNRTHDSIGVYDENGVLIAKWREGIRVYHFMPDQWEMNIMTNDKIKYMDRVTIYDQPPARVVEVISSDECVIRGEGICGHAPIRVWTRLLTKR